MATIEEQQQQDQKLKENVQKAASTGKSVAKAAGKAAAGDWAGAALDLLKNENVRRAIITVLVFAIFIIMGIGYMVGGAITGTVEKIQNSTITGVSPEMLEAYGVASNGNLLYLYAMQSQTPTPENQVYVEMGAALANLLLNEKHEVDGDDTSNASLTEEHGIEASTLQESDYTNSVLAITDEAALVGEDGILPRQMEIIKGRVDQRGKQLESVAGRQYALSGLGIQIATNFVSFYGDMLLYRGINLSESSYKIDTSVFDLTDIQALKIYAAYAVQHDQSITSSDMWDLMDYCGWYSTTYRTMDTSIYKDPNNPNIYNTDADGAFAGALGSIPQGADIATVYPLPAPEVPYWSGTCAPQWYYEQIAQMNAINDAYEAKREELDREYNRIFQRPLKIQQLEEELSEMPYFEEDENGNIILSNFQTIGGYETFGLLDKIYTGGKASVSVIPYELSETTKPTEEELIELGLFIKSLWDEAYGERYKTTRGGGSVYRDEENNHSYTLPNSEAGYVYHIKNTFNGLTSAYIPGNGGSITFNGLNASTTYYVYRQASAAPAAGSPAEAPEVYVDSFYTFESSANNKAYELAIKVDVKFTSRSVDDILFDQLGLWPGALTDTQIGEDGREYATGFVGNELMLKNWTDIYTDPETGEQTEVSFTRQQGYQAETYEDYVLSVATALGYDLTGLFAQDYGYGGTIVSMAQQELAYYTANNLSGGSRYWDIVGQAEHNSMFYYDHSAPWDVAFINACAYQCGFIDTGGWYGGEEWPYSVAALYTKLVSGGHATGHSRADNYMPVPGDLILFGSSVGCPDPIHIGIVEYVDMDGKVHTIEGNSGNQLKRCVYDNYQVGSYAWDGAIISHYINPHYPSSFISNPAYQAIQTDFKPAASARLVADTQLFLAGLPRFRYEIMGEVLDELATMYPELYTAALRLAYPHTLGSCRVNGLTWLIPMEYTDISPYGMRVHPIYGDYRMHEGADMGAPQGTPIFAPRSGVVYQSGYQSSYGYHVIIDHDGGYRTEYYHMVDQPPVTTGEQVKPGQIIGYCGSTGDSTGPHLHYEVWLNGALQDPYVYLGLRSAGSGAVDRDDPDATASYDNLIAAWNALATSKASRFEEAQMNIAAKLYVQPVAQKITVNNGFNWTQTRLREEILWAIVTTSYKEPALVSVMQSLSSGLNNNITDQELYEHLANDDFLVKTVMASKYNLWPDDSVEIQNEWITGLQLLMQALEEKYAPAPPVEVEGGGQ